MIRALRFLSLTVLYTTSVIAHALTDQPAENNPNVTQTIATKPGLHFVLSAGLTTGGDTIATASYANGSSKNVNGGGLAQFGLGGSYQFEDAPLALLLSANYHFHTAAGSNGDITFSRVPIEVLGYYTGVERLRFGGGVRIVQSPEVTSKINGTSEKITFDNTTGYVAEVGYNLAPTLWINLRYVSEKYQGNTRTFKDGSTASLKGTSPISGSHVGVIFAFEF